LCRRTSGRSFAKAKGRSGGRRFRESFGHARTDQLVLEMFPRDEHLHRWIKLAQKRVKFQGLPSRICWLGYGERDKFGLALNELVAKGEIRRRW